MQKYTFYMLDEQGHILLTVTSQLWADEIAARKSIEPVRLALEVQYGTRVFLD